MNEVLIAPCGMNCGICSAYLAAKYDIKTMGINMPYCTGCRPRNKQCYIKRGCRSLLKGEIKYCYECPDIPCEKLLHLNQRYITNFRMSMIENLEYIKERGINQFLLREEAKWRCPECGDVISCHNGICYNCGLARLRDKRVKNRW